MCPRGADERVIRYKVRPTVGPTDGSANTAPLQTSSGSNAV